MDQNPSSDDAPERPGGEPITPPQGQPAGPVPNPYGPGFVQPQGQAQAEAPQYAYTPPAPPPSSQPQPQPQPQQMSGPPPGYQYPPQYPPQPQTPPRKSGVPVWVWVLLGIVGVLVIGCVLFFVATAVLVNQASKVAEETGNTINAGLTFTGFDLAMTLGNYEDAHSYLGGELANRYTPEELQRRWEALGGGTTPTTNTSEPSASGKAVVLTWTITAGDGTEHEVKVTMEQVGSDWKITRADPDLIPQP